MSFRYFDYGEEQQFVFLQVPKMLLRDERYAKLSGDAILLYGIMLDRGYLSKQNGWYDEEGHPFIYFTAKAIQKVLGVGRTKAFELLADLEECELIKRRRQGHCKPNQIYVGHFYHPDRNPDFMKYGKRTSGSTDGEPHDVRYTDSNNNDINKTKKSEINPIYPCDGMDGIDVDNALADYLEEQCCFEILKHDYPHRESYLDSIRELMIEICTSKAPTVRINSEDRPTETVKSRFMKLNMEHIRYVCDCLMETTTKISNIRAYLLTALFNAPVTIDHYYTALVNYDMAHPKE